jgi:hypothetical protein
MRLPLRRATADAMASVRGDDTVLGLESGKRSEPPRTSSDHSSTPQGRSPLVKSTPRTTGRWTVILAMLLATLLVRRFDVAPDTIGIRESPRSAGWKLNHEESLLWIAEHRAWRLARKTKPIWARPVAPEEVGKEFQTADHVKEVARQGAWLCIGVAGEPWFQSLEKIEAKYTPNGETTRKFESDNEPRRYQIYIPKLTTRNWVAQVKSPGVAGFSIRPGYDPSRPLYSPAGGYVVRSDVPDPYRAPPDDVWLVQEPLFDSTYELLSHSYPGAPR